MTTGTTYEIIDGVRRAKAFQVAGLLQIRAIIVDASGRQTGPVMLPIDDLRSPHKSEIDASSTPANSRRYNLINRAVGNGHHSRLPPILVQEARSGAVRGCRIRDVRVT